MVMGSSRNLGNQVGGSNNGNGYDYSFKILLIGDSGVGKSSLLLSFISNSTRDLQDLSPTIGTLCVCVYSSTHVYIYLLLYAHMDVCMEFLSPSEKIDVCMVGSCITCMEFLI